MQKLEIQSTNLFKPLLNYIPAELHENKEWIIVFYVIDPIKKKLVRQRKRVPKHKRVVERRIMAKRMVALINSNLEKGWNPIITDESPRSLTLLPDVANEYLNYLERDYRSGQIRKDTFRSYSSYMRNFISWLKLKGYSNEYVLNFKSPLVSEFLDYIYIERNNTTTTYNNYLVGLRLLSKFMLRKGYIKNNPLDMFSNKKKAKKKRGVIEKGEIEVIFNELDQIEKEYSLLCKIIFYCYIRPAELSKLRVKDILLEDNLIYLSPETSKKSSGYVTIPERLIKLIRSHITKANGNDYLFSRNYCKPGKKQANGKMYYDRWIRYIVKKGYTTNPLYSLKDSGITLALDGGVSPVSVMNQARHSDLSITTAYLRKPQQKADISITNANW